MGATPPNRHGCAMRAKIPNARRTVANEIGLVNSATLSGQHDVLNDLRHERAVQQHRRDDARPRERGD